MHSLIYCPLPTARCLENKSPLFTICTLTHHHTLKRRLTPAENEVTASLAAPLLRAVFFIGREDSLARAVALVLCAA